MVLLMQDPGVSWVFVLKLSYNFRHHVQVTCKKKHHPKFKQKD